MFKVVKITSGKTFSQETLFRTSIFEEVWDAWERKVQEHRKEIQAGIDTGEYTAIFVMDVADRILDAPKELWDKITKQNSGK